MSTARRTYSRIEDKITTSLALSRGHVAALDARAIRQGITRSGVLRNILDDVLGDEAGNPETISFPDLIETQQAQRLINPKRLVRKLAL